MVRTRKRTTVRQNWTSNNMINAVKAVIYQKISLRESCERFKVPKSTLERKIRKKRNDPNYNVGKKDSLGSIRTVFTEEEERELASYIQLMESRLFGLGVGDLKKMAFQLAEKNNIKHTFSYIKKEAGYDWYQGFMKRHPELSLRKPEATSTARAMGFNKRVVTDFFQLLGGLMDKYKFRPDRIYNCDETGISSVPKSKSKIIASKGRKQVGSITSAERGETVTVEICMNAAGTFMPPFFIFPRKSYNSEFMRNASPGSTAEFHESGWMQKEIFEKWMKRFIQFSHATKENPVLLLLDGHCTHTKSIELIDIARDNGVILLCFPPHCTHRLQPLDVAFMKPLSTYYDKETTNWLRTHGGKVVTLKYLAEIFSLAFIKSATMTTAINGFKKTGIYPFNQEVFCDVDFCAADTTNLQKESISSQVVDSSEAVNSVKIVDCTQVVNSTKINESNCTPGCSHWVTQTPVIEKTAFKNISPKDILPVPQQTVEIREKKKRNIQFKGKIAIITESPCKKTLEDQQNRNKGSIKRGVKKNLFPKSNETSKKKMKNSEKSNSESNLDCLYCGGYYLESVEAWVQCILCLKWAHCSCTGENSKDKDLYYICDICKP